MVSSPSPGPLSLRFEICIIERRVCSGGKKKKFPLPRRRSSFPRRATQFQRRRTSRVPFGEERLPEHGPEIPFSRVFATDMKNTTEREGPRSNGTRLAGARGSAPGNELRRGLSTATSAHGRSFRTRNLAILSISSLGISRCNETATELDESLHRAGNEFPRIRSETILPRSPRFYEQFRLRASSVFRLPLRRNFKVVSIRFPCRVFRRGFEFPPRTDIAV